MIQQQPLLLITSHLLWTAHRSLIVIKILTTGQTGFTVLCFLRAARGCTEWCTAAYRPTLVGTLANDHKHITV